MNAEAIDPVSRYIEDSARAMGEARTAMKQAEIELDRRQRLIEDYRRKDAEHERMIGELLVLLSRDDLDGARDIVKAEFDAIHGPRD